MNLKIKKMAKPVEKDDVVNATQNEQPQKTLNASPETKKKLLKWFLMILLIGALITMFYFSCAPTSKKIEVEKSDVVNSKLQIKDKTGQAYSVASTKDTWSNYYVNLGNGEQKMVVYLRTVDSGTVWFYATRQSSIGTTGKRNVTLTIGNQPEFKIISEGDRVTDGKNGEWYYDTIEINSSVPSEGISWGYVLINFLPTLLLLGLMFWSISRMSKMQGMGGEDSVFGIGKSQAKIAQSNVKFTDVAGIEEEKAELIEIVDYLKNPEKYAAMGARTPRGVILYGPPGTGKTLLAKAVAGEAKVPFFQVSGSAFEDMLVGVGAKRVRDLFNKAKKAAPSIIFIDELDSVASKRGKYDVAGSSGLADQTINQLLAEMDGFSTRTGVVVMAATNRLDVLDDAILRPGRFDRHIQVNLPDIKEREAILRIHAKNKNISTKVALADVARRTPGFSGAQLENVLNEATLLTVRFNKTAIGMDEIDEAIDRVIAGPAKRTRVITESEKKQIAYHEAGHALVGLHMPGSDVVEKITIIPRGRAAGYTLSTPEKQEITIQKKSDLLSIITSILGGRAAEEIVYGNKEISTGAANDLYKVTNIVRSMVTQLGMTDTGMTQFIPSEGVANPYMNKMYSEQTAQKIDASIEKIIQDQYKLAKEIIEKNKEELDIIVESLILLETIVKSQIDYIHANKKLPAEAIEKKKQNEALDKNKAESKNK